MATVGPANHWPPFSPSLDPIRPPLRIESIDSIGPRWNLEASLTRSSKDPVQGLQAGCGSRLSRAATRQRWSQRTMRCRHIPSISLCPNFCFA